MRKIVLTVQLIFFCCISLKGEVEPPIVNGWYEISSLNHLRWVSENPSSWDKNFKLMNDINAADTKNWNDGAGWSPIGNEVKHFTGKFDGHTHIIDSLYIIRPNQNNIGFFGKSANSTCMIKNFGVTNLLIRGKNYTGGLVGYNDTSSTVSNCYASGRVSGSGYATGGLVGYNDYFGKVSSSYSSAIVLGSIYTGGLVGYNDYSGMVSSSYSSAYVSGSTYTGGLIGYNYVFCTVNKCYSTAYVSGSSYTGGLVGCNWFGNISYCYSTAIVSGLAYTGGLVGCNDYYGRISSSYSTGNVSGTTNTGGLIGSNSNARESKCFWDMETSGQKTSAGGIGKTTLEMGTKSTFTNAGWNFSLIWKINKIINNGYPFIDTRTISKTEPKEPIDTDGDGYLNIKYLAHLVWVSENSSSWSSNFELENDINADSTIYWDTLLGFSPIGNETTPFTGKFDGNGHIIDSLYIDRMFQNNIGLFGNTSSSSCEIRKLGLTNCIINGKNNTGGLIGVNESGASVSYCYAIGIVSGVNNTGGLIGVNESGASVSYCYATGSVPFKDNTGGLVGYNQGMVTNCFWDREINGYKKSAGGGIGITTLEMKTKSTFTNTGWNFLSIWKINANKNNGYPYIDIRTIPKTVAKEPTDTDGDGYINIKYLAHLVWVSENSSSWSSNFELDNTINADSTIYWDILIGFSPIGNDSTPFTGKFDGNGYIIDSLYIDRKFQNYIGLFGYISGNFCEVNNIGIYNSITIGNKFSGGLVGYIDSAVTVSSCFSTGFIYGGDNTGGLVGYNAGTVINCYSTDKVSGSTYIGGLVGRNEGSAKNCYSIGKITGKNYIGGLVGDNITGEIINCFWSSY